MTRIVAWILGILMATACSNDSSQNPGGPASTTQAGTTGGGGGSTSGGSAGVGGGTVTTSGAGGASGASGSGGTTSSGGAGGGMAGSGTGGAGGVGGAAGTTGTGGAVDSGATGGSSGMDGSLGNDAADSGGTGGAPGMDASVGNDAAPPGTCSQPGSGPTPPAGFIKVTNPPDMKFPFTTHWMGTFSDTSKCVSMTSLTDIDKDGDQDFASGQRDPTNSCGTAGAPMVWWEYCSPDHWVKHTVGTGYQSAAAGGAGDFDNDGWIDLVVGNSWFKNPGASVRTAGAWTRYGTGAPGVVEEITMGELDGDGRLDVVYVENTIDPQWGRPGANPTQNWTLTRLSAYRQQQGGAIGDLDGDGDNDILIGDRWWYKNPGTDGGTWTPMPIPAFTMFASSASQNGSAPMTMIGDIDGDGDNDFAMHTHWGGNIAWMENRDGMGTMWVGHMIAPAAGVQAKTNLHGVLVNDFDNDGDIDIFASQNQGSIFIYENTDGKGTLTEHTVANGPGHEPRTADVDCDGDLDIVGKPWGNPDDPRGENPPETRAHVYFKNELVERGGRAVFDRPKSEVWNVPNKGRCR
jgi:hypothetical protein